MGTDIHAWPQYRNKYGAWVDIDIKSKVEPMWNFRNYGAFAILADVRNKIGVTPLLPRRGIPIDFKTRADDESNYDLIDTWDYHSWHWYTLEELITFNYDAIAHNGISYRDMLHYALKDVNTLLTWAREREIEPEDVRVVFAFDS